MKNLVDVVVVNWNAGEQLRDCILSVMNYGGGLINRIIIVDNASTDNSLELLGEVPNVEIIFSGDNLGFGRACNLGAKNSTSEFLLFLNPDAMLYSSTLANSLAYLKESNNVKVGICGVQLLDKSGNVARSCAKFPTPFSFFCYAIGLDRIFPRLGFFMATWPHDQKRIVDHVIGAFFLVRCNMFKDLGGFDEGFFVYMEDLDFSFRAHQAGWQSVFLGTTFAYHAGGGSSNQIKSRRLFYSIRSRLLYSFKHFNALGAFLVLISVLFLEPVSRTINGLFSKSWLSIKETWCGYFMLLHWLPKWLFKGVRY